MEGQAQEGIEEGNEFEICELMTDSGIMDRADVVSEGEDDQNMPSIIRNLEEAEPKPETRISIIMTSFEVALYEQEMKTMRTLGIIPEENTIIESCGYLNEGNKKWDDDKDDKDDTSTKMNSIESQEMSQGESNFSSFPYLAQSQISDSFTLFHLRKGANVDKCFSLFRNYLLRNKLEVVSDSFNAIVARLKPRRNNFSAFFESIVERPDVNICLCHMSTTNSLKMTLAVHPKHIKSLSKCERDLRRHSQAFKHCLWESLCLQTQEEETIDLVLAKEGDSVLSLGEMVRRTTKEQYSDKKLEDLLVRVLQMRDLLMYQLEEKEAVFKRLDPLVELEKRIMLQTRLYEIYQQFHSKNEQRYQQRKVSIKAKYPLLHRYDHLGISQQYRLEDQQGNFPYDTALQQLQSFFEQPHPHLHISEIQQFYNCIYLCQQFVSQTHISSHPNIRSLVNIQSETQMSVESEKSHLGLVVLCLVESDRREMYHKVRLMEHYLKVTDNTKCEAMCQNLVLAMDYIESSWEVN